MDSNQEAFDFLQEDMMCSLQDKPGSWILLDIQLTIDVFSNKKFEQYQRFEADTDLVMKFWEGDF